MNAETENSHYTDLNTENTMYIKCKDSYGNLPGLDECSIIVKPSSSIIL